MNTINFEKTFNRSDAQEGEREIKISGSLSVWNEPHPYGSGYAGERMTEVTDFTIEVDGEPMSGETFRETFPGTDLGELIDQAAQ